MLGVIAVGQTAMADDLSDLKAEIAAQKQAAAQEKARLDALEKKLASVQAQSSAGTVSASAPVAGGDGFTYKTANQQVTLYGQIEVTTSSANNKDAAGNTKVGFQTPWFSGSRWGIIGSRDLNVGDLKAIYKLESEFVPATGEEDTAGVLFNRDAYAGLQSEGLGKLTFGRQNALGRDFSAIYGDPYGAVKVSTEEGGYANTNNFKQLVYYGGGADGTRYNSGVVWKKAFSSGIVAGLGYSFGGGPSAPAGAGTAANPAEGTTFSAGLGYNAGAVNVSSFYTQARVDGLTDSSYSFGGNYSTGAWRLNAGYYHYTADQGALGTRTDNAYTISAKYAPTTLMDYEVGYQVMKADNAARSATGVVPNAFASIAGLTTLGSGNRTTVYSSYIYHFDKSTDGYIAADYLTLDSGYGAINGYSNQTEVAVGLRIKF